MYIPWILILVVAANQPEIVLSQTAAAALYC